MVVCDRCRWILYWRLFIFVGARSATDVSKLTGNYLNDMRHMVIRLVLETGKDFLGTSMFAWFVQPYQLLSNTPYSNLGIAILIAGSVIGLVVLYLFLLKRWQGVDYNTEEMPNPFKEFIGSALLLFCAQSCRSSFRGEMWI